MSDFDKDAVSLKILTDWNSREYNCEGQKQASLQVLINTALEEQQAKVDKLENFSKEQQNQIDRLYDSFQENIDLRHKLNKASLVVEAADNMICMYDVADGVEVAKARILLEKALSELARTPAIKKGE